MSLPPFLETLAKGPVVFDGATGTMLYERGIFLNKCFDELCLSRPELVENVHRAYVDVGADVVQTNSYGANRISLARHGLEAQVEPICTAAAAIARQATEGRAYVAGAVGPTGLLPKDLIQAKTRHRVLEAYREQTRALVAGGVDLLVFETFHYLGELEIAVEAAYDANVPICAFASFDDDGQTADGAEASEVAERLFALGVDVVGANCVLGPERLLEIMQGFVAAKQPGKYVAMEPNAGYPRTVDGRAIYQSSPETFGVCARRAFKAGVDAVGGCCGTGPDHIRRVVASARMLGGGRWRSVVPAQPMERLKGQDPVPLDERSRFGRKIAAGEFATSVEVLPPVGLDATKILEKVQVLAEAGVDGVNIPDGPRAMVRMSNLALAKMILDDTDMEPLVHFCARDRNLLALQGDLLGAHALGMHNLVVITGDPPKVGDYPDATAVFDLDSIGMLQLATGLNRGLDPVGKSIGERTSFVLATGAEPAAIDFEREVKRLFEKRDAGAELVMTQPVFDPAVLDRFLEATKDLGLPVLVGVLPLASSKNAEFLHANVPGMQLSDAVRARLKGVPDGKAQRAEGIKMAAEALASVKDRVQGAYLMPPFGRVEAALEVLDLAGVELR
jgi:homocysteine S-methyltransferase